MGTVGNGNGNGRGHGPVSPAPRWRPDALVPRPRPSDEGTVSGRRFVIAAIAGVLIVWGLVYAGFTAWRSNYRALAAYGAAEVAPLVDPMADRVPTSVDPTAWKKAVADTHAMLVALTGSGLLDRPMMEGLRAEVAARVSRSTPETARGELAGLWDDLERKAGPVISPDVTPAAPGSRHASRHERPARPALLVGDRP